MRNKKNFLESSEKLTSGNKSYFKDLDYEIKYIIFKTLLIQSVQNPFTKKKIIYLSQIYIIYICLNTWTKNVNVFINNSISVY